MSWEEFLWKPEAPPESEAPIGYSSNTLLNNEQLEVNEEANQRKKYME